MRASIQPLCAAIGVVMLTSMVAAQAPAPSSQPLSLDAIQKAVDAQQRTVPIPYSPDAPPVPGEKLRQLGVVSLLAPDPQHGEVVRIGVPVGGLTMRMAGAIGSARRGRAERKAGERVQRDLDAFLAQRKQKK
jgi:hypothetical protein